MAGRARAGAWAALLAAAACGGGSPPHATTSLAALESERVAHILERRHPSHAPLDAALAVRAYDGLLRALDPGSGCAAGRGAAMPDGHAIAAALRAGDYAFARDAARTCTGRSLDVEEAKTLALEALATAYDPFSHYLDARALARRRAEVHASAPTPARGRIVEHAGTPVALVELDSFYLSAERSASADVGFLVRELSGRGARVLVIDLRGNGGGVVHEALALAGALLGGGPIAHERDASGGVQLLASAPLEAIWRGPLVLIIDRGTGSMAELFAAALQDRGRALLAGEPSYGKGLAQTLVLLSSPLGGEQGAVEVSERAFYRLDGSVLQGRGVAPDVAVAFDADAPRAAPFTAPWLPARVRPLATARSPLDAARVERARAAAGPAGDPLERILAAAAALAAEP